MRVKRLIPEALNEDLYFNLDRANLLMRRRILDILGIHHVSPEQWEIFQFINNQDGISQSKLSDLTMKDKGNISRTIARMVRNGWLCRVAEKPRGVTLKLTEQGRQVKSSLPNVMSGHISRLLEPLPREERTEMLYCLKKLRVLLGDDGI